MKPGQIKFPRHTAANKKSVAAENGLAAAARLAGVAPEHLAAARRYGRLFTQAGRRLSKLFEPLMAADGVTGPQYLILLRIMERPGMTQQHLVEEMDIDPSTISDVVRRLLKKGLISRVRHSEDRRAFALKITNEGARRTDRIHGQIDQLSIMVYGKIPPKHRAAILDWLNILATLEHMPRAAEFSNAK